MHRIGKVARGARRKRERKPRDGPEVRRPLPVYESHDLEARHGPSDAPERTRRFDAEVQLREADRPANAAISERKGGSSTTGQAAPAEGRFS